MILNLHRFGVDRTGEQPDHQARDVLLVVTAGTLVTAMVCGLLLLQPMILERILNASYDLQFSLLSQPAPSRVPVIVEVDDRSLEQVGQWPWSRHRMAELLSALAAAGVSAVGIDVLFAEPDRTSPAVLERRLKGELGAGVSLRGVPETHRDYDAILAATLANGPFVTGFYFDFGAAAATDCAPRSTNIALLARAADASGGSGLHSAPGVLCNIPRLLDAAGHGGFINGRPDDDGIYRRTPLLIEHKGRIYPSLSLQTLVTAAGIPQLLVESHAEGFTVRLGDRRIPLDAAGNLLVRFRGGGGSYDTISASSVLNGLLDPELLRGRIAFLGVSATGLAEYRPIPLDPLFTGVELHASVLDNILRGDHLIRPRAGQALELASALLAGFSFSLLLAWAGPLAIALATPLALAAVALAFQLLLAKAGLVLSPLPSMLAVISVLLVVSLLKYGREQLRRKGVVRQIVLSQEATIEGFAAMAEFRDPDTGGHIKRIQHFVRALAEQLRRHPNAPAHLDGVAVELLYKAAPLHDIGKIGVPDNVLLKPGPLTEQEFAIMQRHTELGAHVIGVIESKLGRNQFLRIAREVALSHHEKWDGAGYPRHLAGEQIPLSARLMAVADVYDALTSRRIYKPAFPHDKAVAIIREGRGSHFDPMVVEAFLDIEDEFRRIALTFTDQRQPAGATTPFRGKDDAEDWVFAVDGARSAGVLVGKAARVATDHSALRFHVSRTCS